MTGEAPGCYSGKLCWADQAAAEGAAVAQSAQLGGNFGVYRCPGRRHWHTTSGWVHPYSLRSWCRIVAWLVGDQGSITPGRLAEAAARTAARAGMLTEHILARRSGGRVFRDDVAALLHLHLIGYDLATKAFVSVDSVGLREVCAVGVLGVRAQRGQVWAPVPQEWLGLLSDLWRQTREHGIRLSAAGGDVDGGAP